MTRELIQLICFSLVGRTFESRRHSVSGSFCFHIVSCRRMCFVVSSGSPMAVGTLEEIIDDNHAIVSTSVGSEHYVTIMSFVDKDQLEPGCTVLLNHKVMKSNRSEKELKIIKR